MGRVVKLDWIGAVEGMETRSSCPTDWLEGKTLPGVEVFSREVGHLSWVSWGNIKGVSLTRQAFGGSRQ